MTKIGIYNHKTGEQEVRDMNEAELAQFEAEIAASAEKKAVAEAKEAAKNAILERLGITEDEAKILGIIADKSLPIFS